MENQNTAQSEPVQNPVQSSQAPVPPIPPSINEPKRSFPIPKIVLLGIVFIILLAIIGGGYFIVKNSSNNSIPVPSPAPVVYEPTPTTNSITNWKILTNKEAGYSLQYPKEFSTECENPDEDHYLCRFDQESESEPSNFIRLALINKHENSENTSQEDIDDRNRLLNAKVGDKIPNYGGGEITSTYERLPDTKIGTSSAKTFIDNSSDSYGTGGVQKIFYISQGENLYRLDGFLKNGDISVDLFDQIASTFKLIQ